MDGLSKYTALSLNLDSFGHATGTFPLENDPFWFQVLDLILEVLDTHKVKATIYVIGKDLQNQKIRERVKSLHLAGHEIGNHTYNHKQNFGVLEYEDTLLEIRNTHLAITSATGTGPVSFLAPAWNRNPHQSKILASLGYSNDSSIFGSPLMFLMNLKMAYNFVQKTLRNRELPRTYDLMSVFKRKDLCFNLLGSNYGNIRAQVIGNVFEPGVAQLPMTPYPWVLPYWFTLEFISEKLAEVAFSGILNQQYRYLLFHPADFANEEDLGEHANLKNHSLERFYVDKERYRELFERRIVSLKRDSSFVTMSELANQMSQ